MTGKKIQYFDAELGESYVPHVVETSVGADRLFLATLSHAYREEMVPTANGGEEMRVVLKLHPAIAPIKCAIFPLLKNNSELVEKAQAVFNSLKASFSCQYDEKDSIGRRYRRHDEIGTPFCVTIDHDTLTDGKVTIRHRDTLHQDRVLIEHVEQIVASQVDMRRLIS